MGAATLDIVLYYAMVLHYALMLSFENDEHLPRQARGKHENENGLLTKPGALLLLFCCRQLAADKLLALPCLHCDGRGA
jgi:hypothetical protein